jgi:translation initiation factor 2B subunit (eIF-2B alpha/beta/delta family)
MEKNQTIKDLLSDITRGSTALYQDALDILLLLIAENDIYEIHKGCSALRDKFAVMGLFQNLYYRLIKINNLDEIQKILLEYKQGMSQNIQSIKAHAQACIPKGSVILTISHSNLVQESIITGNRVDSVIEVYCLKSGPANEGINLFKNLIINNVAANIIEDSLNGDIPSKISLIMSGCDLITEKFFINKKGTANIAKMAINTGIPLWIVTEKSRFISDFNKPITIENNFEAIPLRKEFFVLSEYGLMNSAKYLMYSG